MASVKWLRRIGVVATPFDGMFQTISYMDHWPDKPPTPVTTMGVRAFVSSPTPGTVLPPSPHIIRGKAWSGSHRSIGSVEISIDAGPCQSAHVAPKQDAYGWQTWWFDWDATNVGRHSVRARDRQ